MKFDTSFLFSALVVCATAITDGEASVGGAPCPSTLAKQGATPQYNPGPGTFPVPAPVTPAGAPAVVPAPVPASGVGSGQPAPASNPSPPPPPPPPAANAGGGPVPAPVPAAPLSPPPPSPVGAVPIASPTPVAPPPATRDGAVAPVSPSPVSSAPTTAPTPSAAAPVTSPTPVPTPIDAAPVCSVAYDCVARQVVCGNPATFAADPACVGKEAEAKQAIDCCKSSSFMVCGTNKPALNETLGLNDTIASNGTVGIQNNTATNNTNNNMCYETRSASLVDRIRQNDAFQKCMGIQQVPTDNRTCEVVYDCNAKKLKCGAPSLFENNGTCKGQENLAAAQVKCGIKLHTIMCTSGLDASNHSTCNTAYMITNPSKTDEINKCVSDNQQQLAAIKQAGTMPNSSPLVALATTFAFIVGGLYATLT